MNQQLGTAGKVVCFAAAVAVALATPALAAKGGKPGKPGGDGCPRDILCTMEWDPVICDDGQVYSNDCVAYQQCATGCEPYGDGGPVPLEAKGGQGGGKPGKDTCPRDILCPMVWDPVICDDGQLYSNDCVAYQQCATGCAPYDDGGPVPLGDSGHCPRDVACPDVLAPVACADGQLYLNRCDAFAQCATDCGSVAGTAEGIGGWPGKPGLGDCPKDIYCLDVWDPVICDDGNVYSNDCYASRACATGCEPYGGPLEAQGGPPAKPGKPGLGDCPKDIYCLDVWDPVICDDGNVYSNDCYALRACATGCEPWGGPLEATSGADDDCPRDVQCLDVWDPVVCKDGRVYSNGCYAFRACAKGCQSLGGGPIAVRGGKPGKPGGDKCPRDILCLDVWDPVICDDGQVYSNSCYAYQQCATGCEPL